MMMDKEGPFVSLSLSTSCIYFPCRFVSFILQQLRKLASEPESRKGRGRESGKEGKGGGNRYHIYPHIPIPYPYHTYPESQKKKLKRKREREIETRPVHSDSDRDILSLIGQEGGRGVDWDIDIVTGG